MAVFFSLSYFTTLSFLVLYFQTLTADPNFSFSFKNFGNDSNFESQLALYGNTKVVNAGSFVQLSGSPNFKGGRFMYKKPIKIVEGKTRTTVSFSTYFSFSMSQGNVDGFGLAFVMVPTGVSMNVFNDASFGLFGKNKFKILGVKFDTIMNNGNLVGVDVISPQSVEVSNISSINLVMNTNEKLQSWIDYEAGLKRLEVRLSRLGQPRPANPLHSYPIDLSNLWKEKDVILGLSSSSKNSWQECNVYSWSFKLRWIPHWMMHSQPLDPSAFAEKTKTEDLTLHKRSNCILRVLGSLILGTGCGALGAFVVLFGWTIFVNRRPVVPEEYAVDSVEYKKFEVVVDKAIENGK